MHRRWAGTQCVAVARAGVAPAEVEDVIMGAALQQGCQGSNVGRQVALAAGLPDSVPGMSLDRQCSSGLMAIATAAKQIMHDGMQVAVGGGLESVSLVQNDKATRTPYADPAPMARVPWHRTCRCWRRRRSSRIVIGVPRDAQDDYALRSQQRTAACPGARRLR